MADERDPGLNLDGCVRLAGAVLESALKLPAARRAEYLAGPDFRFWAELAGADAGRLRREIDRVDRAPARPSVVVDEDD